MKIVNMNKFLIGAATAPHQVEGNNVYSDYWVQENLPYSPYAEPSGIACDHYNRFEEDIKLLAEAGLNSYRFGIEWARIQPEKDAWDEKEVEHYRKVLLCCRKYGVEPIVTLHHFSSPAWLISLGGWECEETIGLFAGYCKRIVEELGDLMSYVCTINEANMGLQLADMIKSIMKRMMSADVQVGMNFDSGAEARAKYAEAEKRAFGADKVNVFLSEKTEKGDDIIFRAHVAAKEEIKKIRPELKVGVTLSLHDFQPLEGGEDYAEKQWDMEFTHYLPYIANDDFLGVQNYTRKAVDNNGTVSLSNVPLTQMGYEDYPKAIGNIVRKAAKDFKKEILVTENGIATDDDNRRIEFIKEAIDGVLKAKTDGIPVIGYTYWTLMDNYEWQKAYEPKFGLIAVDRKTMERHPKNSLKYLGELGRKL